MSADDPAQGDTKEDHGHRRPTSAAANRDGAWKAIVAQGSNALATWESIPSAKGPSPGTATKRYLARKKEERHDGWRQRKEAQADLDQSSRLNLPLALLAMGGGGTWVLELPALRPRHHP